MIGGAILLVSLLWLSRRAFHSGEIFSVLVSGALALTLGVVGYLLLVLLPIEEDFSPYQQFTLSPRTQSVLQELQTPINLYQVDVGDQEQLRRDRQLVDRFIALQQHQISHQSLQPFSDIELVREFSLQRGDRYVVVRERDGDRPFVRLREVNEGTLLSAIERLSQSQTPVISYLTGHGEPALDSTQPDGMSRFKELAFSERVELKEVSLLQDNQLEESAAVLLINPRKVLEYGEAIALQEYLQEGGTVVITTDFQSETDLSSLLRGSGVQVSPDPLVRVSQNATGERQISLELPIQSYRKHPITSFLSGKASFIFSQSVSLRMGEFDRSLVSSRSEIFAFQAGAAKRIPLGAVIEWINGGRLFLVSDSTWLTNSFLTRAFNRELAQGMLLWAADVVAPPVMRDNPSVGAGMVTVTQASLSRVWFLFYLLAEISVLFGVGIFLYRKWRSQRTRRTFSTAQMGVL